MKQILLWIPYKAVNGASKKCDKELRGQFDATMVSQMDFSLGCSYQLAAVLVLRLNMPRIVGRRSGRGEFARGSFRILSMSPRQ